jgi:hypothetical protein
MSGRGYHLYILAKTYRAKNSKSCIYNSQHYFIDSLGLIVDAQVIGNPAQLARIPNTWNGKGKRFCIPLTKEQFDKGDEFIKTLANNQNFIKNIIIGEELFNIKKYDCEIKEKEYKTNVGEIKECINEKYFNIAPICIQNLLLKNNIRWKERYLIILFYRELGYTKQEVYNILKNHLSEKKLYHCINEERQLQYLFEKDNLLFPKCENIINDGFCNKKCEKYNNVIYR